MATNNEEISDLPALIGLVQGAFISYPKEMLIWALRDFFSKDSWYHYVKDEWGFPLTPNHTDLPLGSGMFNDPAETGALPNTTTRIYIGENFRFATVYYPCVLIKHGGAKSVPIGLNREAGKVVWKIQEFQDGYGNRTYFKNPEAIQFDGAWEGSIQIDIKTKSLFGRDKITELVSHTFVHQYYDTLVKAGIVIKPNEISVSAPQEVEDRNDKLFLSNITIGYRFEWRQKLPITTVLEIVNFMVDFRRYSPEPGPIAANLSIDASYQLIDKLMNPIYKYEPEYKNT